MKINKKEIKTICCGKKMRKEIHNDNGEQIENYICLACGTFVSIHTQELDAEILDEYRRQYNYRGKHNETIYVIGREK